METLDSNISESNKIPGSGCDTFTRPEEIQALSKYLGYIRKIQDENTRLDNELLGIPGKTTGKFPEIDKLPNEAAELDLSRENQIKSLSDKLVSLDKSSSLNKIENIEHLPDTKVTLTGDEKSESLSNKIVPLGNTDDIERLEDKRENLEVGENINNLETERLNLGITEDIELSNTKETLDITENIELGNTKETLDITEDIELSNTRENLDIIENIELSNTKETLDITEDIELSNIKETLDITEDIELSNIKETLDITDDIELSNIRENLDITDDIELSNIKETLNITENIELSNTRENLDITDDIELSNIKETLHITENIELSNIKETLDITEDIELSNTKENLDITEDIELGNTKETLDITENIELSNTKETLDITEDIELSNTKETLDITENIELSNTKETLDITEDIELGNTRENLDITENIELSNTKETLDITEDIELGNTKETLDITEDIELSNTKENLDITENIELSNTKETLDITENIELSNTKETLDITEDIELGNTRENLDITEDIELGNTRENLDITENIELSNFIDNLLGDLGDISELSDGKISLNNTDHNIQLGDQILTLDDISLVDNLPEESINLGGSIPNINLQTEKEKLDNINEISDLEDLKIKLDTVSKGVTLSDFLDELSNPKSPEIDKDYDYFDPGEDKLGESTLNLPIAKSSEIDKDYDYFNPSNPEAQLYDATIGLEVEDVKKELSNSVINRPEDWVKTEITGGIIYTSEVDENFDPKQDGVILGTSFDWEKKLKDPVIGKYNLTGNAESDVPRVESDYNYFDPGENKLGESKLDLPIDWVKTEYADGIYNSEVDGKSSPDDDFEVRRFLLEKGLKKPLVGKYNLTGNAEGDIPRVESDYDFFQNTSAKGLSEKELYDRIIQFGDDYTKQTSINNSGNVIPDSYNDGVWYDMDTDNGDIITEDGKIERSENPAINWYSKIKSLVSAYLSSSNSSIPEHKIKQFEEKLYGAVKIFQESIKLSGGEIDLPKYKLGDFNNISPSTYLRWLAEESIGNITSGKAREVLLKEALGLLVWGRDELEKLAKAEKHRLPGNSGIISDLVSGGLDVGASVRSASNVISSAISNENINPVNRPEDKETTGWVNSNRRLSLSKEVSNKVEGNSDKKGSLLGTIKDIAIGNPGDNNYNFWSNYLQGQGIATTLMDLAGSDVNNMENGSVEDLYKLLRNSPYITSADKMVTTMSWGEKYNVQTLDSNSHWEIVFEPYIGKLNGNYTFLPSINEINKRNEDVHGVTTRYDKWIPFSSFDLQKEKLVSKSLGLFDGEISYPTGIEFTNELRLTIVDDQFKSWRTYFETCMYASVYSSTPIMAAMKEDERIITIDRNYQLVAPYKNLSFRCRIYVMTPQKSTITKFDLLLVLKDFVSEYSGEIDSSGTDLTLSFSIVGENPWENPLESTQIGTEIRSSIDSRNEESQKKKKTNVWSNLADHAGNTAIKLL